MRCNADKSHGSKSIRLPFAESVSQEYAQERKREQSARLEQEAALKPQRTVMDAFGLWNDVWNAVEDCHSGAEFNWGDHPCDPVALLAGQFDEMLSATMNLCGETKVRLAFDQFSINGYQGYDLDAARTVRVLLEVFVNMLNGASSIELAKSIYRLAPLPHLVDAKAVVNVVQMADRLPNTCQCGKLVGYPFDIGNCVECMHNGKAKSVKTAATSDPPISPIPPKRYGAGEDGLRRDAKIYELAKSNWTNEEIAKEIEKLSAKEKWVSIGPNYVSVRLKEYCLHKGLSMLNRTGGRPKTKT
jgi:hypothetical protein